MPKTMLVNVTHVEESRVAILDNGVLDAYEIETINRTQLKGNIYNAVVDSIHPALEAAFLKIAPDQTGFLPLDEVNFHLLPPRGENRKSGKIGQHLHAGQKLLAQVVREPFSGKPPTVSTYFSLPGRYLVLMPGVDSSGVSRKIEDATQRDRLKKIIDELNPPEGFGVIVRTAGLGQTKAELQRDLRYLLRLWQSIQRASQGAAFPSLVYREADLVIRTIRDHLTPDIEEVWIDSQETYDRTLEFISDVMPKRVKLLRLYTGERPLFNKYNLEEQIESIYKRRVTLPSGGEIVIDGTEALTAVDVNSARSKRSADAEDNATQTNLEAAAEIGRQLRLRDLGGLVVVDFIDMMAPRNRKKVEEAMRDALRSDKAKYDITRISKLGLIEIARQRLRGAKMGATYSACPSCEGYGLIKTLEAAALAALRKLQTRCARGDCGRIRLRLPSDVSTWMLNNKRDGLRQLEVRHNLRIEIEPRESMLRHETDFELSPRERTEAPAARMVGDRAVPLPPAQQDLERSRASEVREEPAPATEPRPEAEMRATEEAPATRRRRRRRRRSPGRTEDAAAEPRASAEGDEPVPGSAAEEADELDAETGEAAENGAEPDPTRARKRRRRKRRPRAAPGALAAPHGEPPQPVQAPEPIVPKNVVANELMPAAAGATQDGRRGAGRDDRRRYRGRGGSRP